MIWSVLAIFGAAPWALLTARLFPRRCGLILALLPLGLSLFFFTRLPRIASGEVIIESWSWAPGLQINLSLYLDGLSFLFALLVGEPFLTGQWAKLEAGVLGQYSLGTPLLFDLGIYLVVIGATLAIVLTLAEEE
ncbi:MAG TPA: hypothetical protein ENN98_02175 [Desulfurivibrio alkaliphilus]|uniref:Na+/H+ antiporter MnhB subunit-related protein domain-containing protein n=1 Tax=Desulfurivibrio alkaliphilus TaxID=427923 RepID=A0A7C2XQL6_9BACT|nr:hypothetical protein [Desulfurivibrio alkaliphilus]